MVMSLPSKIYCFLIFILTLTIACNNSLKPVLENDNPENETDDAYALLREDNTKSFKQQENLSGKVIVLSEKEFIERITTIDNPKGFQYKGQTPCIVELYADWCKPCGYLSQLMNEIAPEYQGKVIFYKLNMDKAPAVTAAFKVSTIPMILYFKPHGEISTSVGYLNREELKKMIDELLLKS